MSDSSCCLNCSFNEGQTTQKKIIPPSITYISKSSKIKGLHFDYKKILNGNIEYVSSDVRDKNKFEGFIKLSKDPQGTVITQQNIGHRGSVLEYADWALGIVIYCGHDCYYYKKKTDQNNKTSYFSKKSSKLFVVSIFFYIFASIVSVLNYFTNSCYPGLPEFNAEGERYRDTSTGKIGMSYMYDYILFLPQFYYFITDLRTLVYAIIQNKYYAANKYKPEDVEEQGDIDFQAEMAGIQEEEGESKSKIYSDKEFKEGGHNKKVDQILNENAESNYDKKEQYEDMRHQTTNATPRKKQKQKNKKPTEKPYIYQINSSKPLADLTLTTHCFIDKTGTLTQGRSFMIHKLYLEDSSYYISENYIDPIFKSNYFQVNEQNKQKATTTNNNEKQIDNLLGFKKSCSIRNESPSLFMNNISHAHRLSIVNTNMTNFTAMNTENQNDIVGEEGIFLRQKLPSCRLNKKKSDLEMLQGSQRLDSLPKLLSPKKMRISLQIDTNKLIAREEFNFKFQDEDAVGGDIITTPSNAINRKQSQQSINIKSQGQVKSSAQIHSNTECKRQSINQISKKGRKISFAENLGNLQGDLKQVISDQLLPELNVESLRNLKQIENLQDEQKETEVEKISQQLPSNKQIMTPQNKHSLLQINQSNTNIGFHQASKIYIPENKENRGSNEYTNGFITSNSSNQKNQQTIQDSFSEISHGSSKIQKQISTAQFSSSPHQSNNSLLNRFRKITVDVLKQSNVLEPSEVISSSKFGLGYSNESVSPLRKINKRYANESIIPQKDESRLFEEIRSDHVKFNSQREAIIAFTVCHVSKTVLHDNISQLITDHQSVYDEIFLEFSKRFDCRLKCIAKSSNCLEYIFKLHKEIHTYHIVVPPVYNQRGTRLNILVRANQSYFLYTREELVNLPFYLKQVRNLRERIEKHLKYMIENGQVGVLFCKKQLTDQQANQMIERYVNIAKGLDFLEKEKQTEQLYREQLSNMEMISLVSLKEKLNPHAKSLVNNLRHSNINTWLVTGDDYQRALAVSYETGMLQKYSKNDIFHFQSETEEETITKMKQNLKTIKELLDSDKDQKSSSLFRKYQNTALQRVYNRMISGQNEQLKQSNITNSKTNSRQSTVAVCVIVNGQCLNQILNNQYLRDHFAFICFFCESLIGYSLKPSQKAELVSLVKTIKTDGIFTLAIGDGLNDLQMMQNADFSIQYQNQNLESLQFEHGLSQVTVSQLSQISNLIFSQSRNEAELFEETMHFTFYRSFFIFFLVFFWNFSSCSYGDMILNITDIIMIHFVSLLFQSILYFYRKNEKMYKNKQDSFTLIQQYFQNKNYFGDVFKKFILQIIPQSLIDGLLLFFQIYQMNGVSMTLTGLQMERQQLTLITVVIFYFLVHLKVIILLNQSKSTLFANILFPAVMSILYVSITNYFEPQFFYSHLTILVFAAIFFNFVTSNFLTRIIIPLIQQGMMRNSNRFRKIFRSIEEKYQKLLATFPQSIFSKQQQQQFLSDSQALGNDFNLGVQNNNGNNSTLIRLQNNNSNHYNLTLNSPCYLKPPIDLLQSPCVDHLFAFNGSIEASPLSSGQPKKINLNQSDNFHLNSSDTIKQQSAHQINPNYNPYNLFTNKLGQNHQDSVLGSQNNSLKNKINKLNPNKCIESLPGDDNANIQCSIENSKISSGFNKQQNQPQNGSNQYQNVNQPAIQNEQIIQIKQINVNLPSANLCNNSGQFNLYSEQNAANLSKDFSQSNQSNNNKALRLQKSKTQDMKNSVQARRNMKFRGYTFAQIFKMVFKDNEIDTILQDLNTEDLSVISSKINRIFLTFPSKEIELKFAQSIIQSWHRFFRISTIALSIMCELALSQILNYVYEDVFGFNLLCVSFGLYILVWGIMFTPYYSRFFFKVNYLILIIRILSRLTYIFFDQGQPYDNLQTMFYCQILQYSVVITPPVFFSLQFVICISFCIRFLINYEQYQQINSNDEYLKIYLIFTTFISILAFQFLCFLKKYEYDIIERKNFQRINKISVESKKINNVLSILLPKFILDCIDEKGREFQEDQGNVAILFCDVCDFDLIIQEEQSNIIRLLDKLFRVYDDACSINGVQKIETVGKTYMAAAGIQGIKYDTAEMKKTKNFHPVIKCILMANQMFEASRKITYGKQQEKLKIKIGIHYGPALAGVIGGHKPQFSLIGDTVNMASRVCSTGEINFITMSEQAKESCSQELQMLNEKKFSQQNGFQIVLFERVVNAKGKGLIKTYQVSFKKHKKKEIHLLRKFTEKLMLNRSISQNQGSDNSYADQQFSPFSISSPTKKNFSIFSPENGVINTDYRQQGEIKEESEITSSNIISCMNPKKSLSQVEDLVITNKYANGGSQNQKDLQDIQELRSNSMSSNADSQFQANQKQLAYIQVIKDLVDEIQIVPQLEHAHILKDEELDFEKVLSHFQELKNEAINITNQQHKVNCKVNILDIIMGKYKADLQFFYDSELMKSSVTVKNKNAFLCCFEVFKMLIANLMGDYLGGNGVYITFFLHMSSALLLLSTIFGFNLIARSGLKYLKFIIFIIYSMVITSIVLEGYLNLKNFPTQQLINLQTAAVIIIFYVFISFKFISIHEKTFISFCLILNYYVFIIMNDIFEWEYCYLTTAIILSVLYRSFMQLELDFSSYLHTKSLDQKMNDQNKLLEYLLPRHIRDQFLENQSKQINLIDNFDQVTILYADIAGFTKYSASVKPEQVFYMLRELFTKFDQKCQENNVYKLYTIGDCYVVMGLINLKERNVVKEAMNVIGLGFEMIEIIKQVRSIVNFDELDMRIGIHTGSIIGGVVGTGVVRYDIYGPDVVIANKMESNGESGRVMISETTHNLIQEQSQGIYEFEKEQEVYVAASKKTVKGYFVKKSLDNDYDYYESQNNSHNYNNFVRSKTIQQNY